MRFLSARGSSCPDRLLQSQELRQMDAQKRKRSHAQEITPPVVTAAAS